MCDHPSTSGEMKLSPRVTSNIVHVVGDQLAEEKLITSLDKSCMQRKINATTQSNSNNQLYETEEKKRERDRERGKGSWNRLFKYLRVQRSYPFTVVANALDG